MMLGTVLASWPWRLFWTRRAKCHGTVLFLFFAGPGGKGLGVVEPFATEYLAQFYDDQLIGLIPLASVGVLTNPDCHYAYISHEEYRSAGTWLWNTQDRKYMAVMERPRFRAAERVVFDLVPV
jgi:hypothetical protein